MLIGVSLQCESVATVLHFCTYLLGPHDCSPDALNGVFWFFYDECWTDKESTNCSGSSTTTPTPKFHISAFGHYFPLIVGLAHLLVFLGLECNYGMQAECDMVSIANFLAPLYAEL